MKKLSIFLFAISFNTYAFDITPSITGSWYDSVNPGQGFNIEVLENNQILIYWYSYDQGNPIWLTGSGTYQGNTATISLDYFQAGDFGVNHNVSLVNSQPFGDVTFTFESCNKGSMTYNSSLLNFGGGSINLDRLTSIAGLQCGNEAPGSTIYSSSSGISPATTGSWYDSENPGQGFNIEVLDNNQILIYWYSYDQGTPIWLTGSGTYQGNTATISLDYFQAGDFGVNHNASLMNNQPFGDITFTFESCNKGSISYNSSLLNFGSGSINLDRLTSIVGLQCVDEIPPIRPIPIEPIPPIPEEKGCTANLITPAKYALIDIGMSIFEANQIIGCEGKLHIDGEIFVWIPIPQSFPQIRIERPDKDAMFNSVHYAEWEFPETRNGGLKSIVKFRDESGIFHEIGFLGTTPLHIINGELVPKISEQ